MVGVAPLRVVSAVLLAGWVAGAAGQPYIVRVACRDGLPAGGYELRTPDGRLRVAGAFEHGRRSGSFFFWTSASVRIAQIPYDRDQVNGTVALWYAKPAANGEGPRKLVAEYLEGRLHGSKRSWYPSGRPRAAFEYVRGELQSAEAWTASGKRLSDAASRELAARDGKEDAAYLASLEEIVRANHGACSPDANRVAHSVGEVDSAAGASRP
jgi:antitoxin component YwqK of YwqJK toxin-antitoxin module